MKHVLRGIDWGQFKTHWAAATVGGLTVAAVLWLVPALRDIAGAALGAVWALTVMPVPLPAGVIGLGLIALGVLAVRVRRDFAQAHSHANETETPIVHFADELTKAVAGLEPPEVKPPGEGTADQPEVPPQLTLEQLSEIQWTALTVLADHGGMVHLFELAALLDGHDQRVQLEMDELADAGAVRAGYADGRYYALQGLGRKLLKTGGHI